MRNWLRLVLAVALPLCVGFVAGRVTAPAVESWYPGLLRPTFTPPSWLFAPVWTVLYLAMGVASWLVWRQGVGAGGGQRALTVYVVQLALNGLWSVLFFGLRSPGLALVEVVILLAAVVTCTVLFFGISAAAGALMVPYAAWTAFATALNAGIWLLNR